jgi:hypothetical protein
VNRGLYVISTVDAHGQCSLLVLLQVVTCRCGHAAQLLVNRDGRTRCVECDPRLVGGGQTAAAAAATG